jgi:hypothetical protein
VQSKFGEAKVTKKREKRQINFLLFASEQVLERAKRPLDDDRRRLPEQDSRARAVLS